MTSCFSVYVPLAICCSFFESIFAWMEATPFSSASSAASCRAMSIVRYTLLPGSGSSIYSLLMTVPSDAEVVRTVPFVPCRYFSKAYSAPSLPTVASAE